MRSAKPVHPRRPATLRRGFRLAVGSGRGELTGSPWGVTSLDRAERGAVSASSGGEQRPDGLR